MTSAVPHRQRWLRVPTEKWELVETLERFTQRCEELRARVKEGDSPGGTATRELFDQYSELERMFPEQVADLAEAVHVTNDVRQANTPAN